MTLGLIVDGEGEYRGLPLLLQRVPLPEQFILPPVVINANCTYPVNQLVGAAAARIPILAAKGARSVVLVLDRETNDGCPGALASAVEAGLLAVCQRCSIGPARVVVKNRMLENWLIADLHCLRGMPGRFAVSNGVARSVIPNKADSVNALQLLKGAVVKESFEKVSDAVLILRAASPDHIADNSRSFRRFMRVAGHAGYVNQSARPLRNANVEALPAQRRRR